MSSYELYHYGVPRMKHGRRLYQNPDGTWTTLGKERRRQDREIRSLLKKDRKKQGQEAKASKVKREPDDKDTKAKNITRYTNTKMAISESSKIAKEAGNIYSRHRQRKIDALKAKREAEIEKELSEMNDADLRTKINRLNMEVQYKSLKTKDIDSGRTVVNDVLDDAGSILTIGASAATIALAIYQIRNS